MSEAESDDSPLPGRQVFHFSLSNPEGHSGADLPLLLRRVADEIESRGILSDDLLDVTISGDHVNEYGSWWRVTVYWSPDEG